MKTSEDLRIEFEAWFKATFSPIPAGLDQVKLAMVQEVARRAYMAGNAGGFNDGMSTAAKHMEGGHDR